MALFDFLRPRIDHGVDEYIQTPGAVLLDVRSPDEFRKGRIPGSTNVPLQSIDIVEDVVENFRLMNSEKADSLLAISKALVT